MKYIKKISFIFLLLFAFSFYNCSSFIDDCGCGKTTDSPIEIINIVDASHNSKYNYEVKNGSSVPKNEYYGFDVNFETRKIAYQPKINNETKGIKFSLISSAYACTCESSSVYLKNIYPSTIRIKTLFDLNDTTPAGSLINRNIASYLPYNDTDKTQVDNLAITSVRFEDTNPFKLKFWFPNVNVIQNDSIQFDIEIELNNGEILTTQTPMILLK